MPTVQMLLFDETYSAKTLREIASLFGAVRLEDAYYTLTPDEEITLFFPNLNPKAKTGWYNVRLSNGDFTESNSNPITQDAHLKMHVEDQNFDQIRLIFGKIDGEYCFLGVFRLDKAESIRKHLLYWRRLATSYPLIEPAHLDAKAIQARFVPLKDRIKRMEA